MCKSTKQKLNTKSSTEAEFVGASDYLPNTVWVKSFLEAQGYTIKSNVLGQDNESAIKLERNGRTSAGPKSRHIDIRYFWIKDRLKAGAITVEHCPTLEMLANFFTKPLQGHLFRKFRDVLLGASHVNTLAATPMQPIEERVAGIQSGPHRVAATGVMDTRTVLLRNQSTGIKSTGVHTEPQKSGLRKETWADVVCREVQSSKIVSGSLSRNNPVSDIKV